ncbi:UNKNOWN [Stylonychia lemnae]|uniref:Uncharacterized protein n=1 Tax=Stylonychia lemnae TaxID=5949 RepID=A0A078AX89_STYLE|nr:UNKNOWN [Stylonychia lemnae]|eukprot:CDW85867.1 UNKNOWN [Stylonychia lemnae]
MDWMKQSQLVKTIKKIPPQTQNDIEKKFINTAQQIADSVLTSVLYGSIGLMLLHLIQLIAQVIFNKYLELVNKMTTLHSMIDLIFLVMITLISFI